MARNRPTRDRRMIHIWLYEATRKRLRMRATEEDKTVQAFVEDLIGEALAARSRK